ncbi:hypothetical protein SDC9_148950 [bioreactor metagenome]|uniref:Uncharacterized protein n=1 Tax=bioreactor metagenome TaxID=1076179 RepID=A0A645EKT8_9ZZZZ
MIENLARNLAKTVLNKKEKSSEKINLNQLGSTDILQIMLNRLVHEGNYNKAENMLFEEINKKDQVGGNNQENPQEAINNENKNYDKQIMPPNIKSNNQNRWIYYGISVISLITLVISTIFISKYKRKRY